MNLVLSDFMGRNRSITIAGAVGEACDGDGYDTGALEAAAATARNTSEVLGRLVATLADKGVLDLADIRSITGLGDRLGEAE